MVKLKVRLLKPFKDSVGKNELGVDSDASNVEDFIVELSAKYPKLKPQLIDSEGGVDYSVNVIVNNVPLIDLKQKIKENDEITLFVPIGGG
ncbi:MAG: MoaD family protein [Thermoplasmata archaeon]|nr:MoaD family protein [Thermoplasmata archaeon]